MNAMAFQTQSSHVRQVALASALRDRQNMIGVPERLAPTETPFGYGSDARCAAQLLNPPPLGDAIDAADRAHTAIAFKDAVTQMAGVAAQLPFLYAPLRAERHPARRNFQVAPSAEATPVFSFGKSFAVGAAAGHRALGAHKNMIAIKCLEPRGRARLRPLRLKCVRSRSSTRHRNCLRSGRRAAEPGIVCRLCVGAGVRRAL